MIKKIAVKQLRTGMHVSDFNAGWLDHPFVLNSMKIDTDEQIAKVLASGVKELFIDTDRGLDVGDAPTREEAVAVTERQLERVAETGKSAAPERQVSLAEEMSRAKNTFTDATKIIRGVMDDIRLGRQIELEASKAIVEKITSSVVRNSNAMMTMRRLKSMDDYTFLHSVSVCTMLTTFTRAVDMDVATIHDVALGALLHDVGKMRVNLALLNKPSKLSDEEFMHMKSHVVLGSDLLRQMSGVPKMAFEPLELHHERFDGSGYPNGLVGMEISQVGRMSAIVDVYDAITSDRCYHSPLSPADAIRKLFEWSKFHFDPALVQLFVKSVGIYPIGTLVRLESGRLGIVIEQRESNLLTPVVRVVFDAKRDYYIAPENVDLSKTMGAGGADKIVGHESPGKWKIDVSRFMQ
jgi:HD-GYP domain-containing protein (c-di-GMP phosphodiesterase class II)